MICIHLNTFLIHQENFSKPINICSQYIWILFNFQIYFENEIFHLESFRILQISTSISPTYISKSIQIFIIMSMWLQSTNYELQSITFHLKLYNFLILTGDCKKFSDTIQHLCVTYKWPNGTIAKNYVIRVACIHINLLILIMYCCSVKCTMRINVTQNLKLSRFLISQEFMIFLKLKDGSKLKEKWKILNCTSSE